MAIAALVLGIIGLLFNLVPGVGLFVGGPLCVIALVLGILARKQAAASNAPTGMATTGLALGITGLAIGVLFFVACAVCAHAVDQGARDTLKDPTLQKNSFMVPPAKPTAATGTARGDIAALKVSVKGWDGDFNKILKSWTYEKYTPKGDGTNEPNRVYVDRADGDLPGSADDYAAKLQQKDWQDAGFQYTSIKEKGALPDGFFVVGVVKSQPDNHETPGVVVVRTVGGVKLRCKSGVLVSDALAKEAVALCKSASF